MQNHDSVIERWKTAKGSRSQVSAKREERLCGRRGRGGGEGRAHLFELHDNLGIGLAELVGGLCLAAIRPTLLCLIIHATKLSQQPLLAVQGTCHLGHMHNTFRSSWAVPALLALPMCASCIGLQL